MIRLKVGIWPKKYASLKKNKVFVIWSPRTVLHHLLIRVIFSDKFTDYHVVKQS